MADDEQPYAVKPGLWEGGIQQIGHTVPMSKDALDDGFEKNTIRLFIEDRLALALDFGPPRRPTLEQARDNHRHALEQWQALHDAWAAHDRVWLELCGAEGPALARKMLELHSPEESTWDGPSCSGCDYGGGGDAEPAEWPCTTVDLLAKALDVELPPRPERPRPGAEPPVFQHPDDWEPPKRLRDLFPIVTTDVSAMLYASPSPLDDPEKT